MRDSSKNLSDSPESAPSSVATRRVWAATVLRFSDCPSGTGICPRYICSGFGSAMNRSLFWPKIWRRNHSIWCCGAATCSLNVAICSSFERSIVAISALIVEPSKGLDESMDGALSTAGILPNNNAIVLDL